MNGKGVKETHDEVMRMLVKRISKSLEGDKTAIKINTVHHGNREKADDVIQRHVQAIRTSEASSQDKESIEEATRSRIRRRYAHLKPQAEINLQWVHTTLGEAEPVIILESTVEDDTVRLDLLLQDKGIENAKRITLKLKGRTTPLPIVRPESSSSLTPIPIEMLTQKKDLPPVTYGLAGVLGGCLIGLFISFLLFG